jgi:quercetin dioxygenase-like cupin family protein
MNRVITTVTSTGQSTAQVASVAAIESPAVPGYARYPVAGWDAGPGHGIDAPDARTIPDPGGVRVFTCVFPPGFGHTAGAAGATPADASGGTTAGAASVPPAGAASVPPAGLPQRDPTAMHRTDSVDIGFVMSGQITLVLEACEVVLTAGDVVVQNGTVHAWRNDGPGDCVDGFVVHGVAPTGVAA